MFSFLRKPSTKKHVTIGSGLSESPTSDLEKENQEKLGFLMRGLGNSGLEISALIYYSLHLALKSIQMMFSRTP